MSDFGQPCERNVLTCKCQVSLIQMQTVISVMCVFYICLYCLQRAIWCHFNRNYFASSFALIPRFFFFFGNLQLYGNFVSHKQYGIISETMTFDQIDSCLCVFILNDDEFSSRFIFFFFSTYFVGFTFSLRITFQIFIQLWWN